VYDIQRGRETRARRREKRRKIRTVGKKKRGTQQREEVKHRQIV
jgi:hypothetical protein